VDGKQKTVIEFDLAQAMLQLVQQKLGARRIARLTTDQKARVMEACTQAAAEVAHQLVRKRPEVSPGGTA
jgi:hypothetical protein